MSQTLILTMIFMKMTLTARKVNTTSAAGMKAGVSLTVSN